MLHIITSLSGGGAETFVCSLLPQFDRQVVQPALLAVYPSASNGPLPRDVSSLEVMEANRQGRYDVGFLPRMIAAIRSWHPDIVHTHMHNGKIWGRLAAKIAGVPIVLFTEHNPCEDLRAATERVFDRAMNCVTEGIITFFEPQREIISKADKLSLKKITVIPNGIVHKPLLETSAVSGVRDTLKVGSDVYTIVAVASFQARKNQQLAIRAMALLPRQLRAHIRLFIIGSGSYHSQLEELTAQLQVEDCVVFTGRRSDVDHILMVADLFLVPSLAEGMPLAILEAMSFGVPVLSTPWIGVNEMLDNGRWGAIIRDWEPTTMATAIIRQVENRKIYRQKALDAQKYVRTTYNIERTARLHERLYGRLAKKRLKLDQIQQQIAPPNRVP